MKTTIAKALSTWENEGGAIAPDVLSFTFDRFKSLSSPWGHAADERRPAVKMDSAAGFDLQRRLKSMASATISKLAHYCANKG
jgi:hypothetical protein